MFHVLLLRDEDGSEDAYTSALRAARLSSACVRALVPHTFGVPALAAALQQLPSLPSCIVLTSRRAALALAAALGALPPASAALLRALPTLCVGARTASGLTGAAPAAAGAAAAAANTAAAAAAAQLPPPPPPPPTAFAGSAAALLPLVIEAARSSSSSSGPVLFVCGERRLDTLPAGLAAAGLGVLEVPVYRVQAAPPQELQAAWAAAVAAAGPAGAAAAPLAVVLFSPSGVEAAHAAGLLQQPAARLLAIGPTTAQALGAAGLPCAAIAPTPTPDGVLQALRSLAQ